MKREPTVVNFQGSESGSSGLSRVLLCLFKMYRLSIFKCPVISVLVKVFLREQPSPDWHLSLFKLGRGGRH